MAYLRDRRAFGNIGTRKFRGARFGDPLSPRGPAYTKEGRVLDYSTDVGPFTIIDQSGEGNTATLYSGRGLTMDAVNDTVTYATGYSSASRTATLWGKFNTTSPVALLGSVSGSFIFTPTATGVWEELTSTATVEGDLAWDLGLDFDIGDLTCATEHWTHNDWSDPTGDTSNGKTIVDSGPNQLHGTCTGCSGFTGEATIPQTADKNWSRGGANIVKTFNFASTVDGWVVDNGTLTAGQTVSDGTTELTNVITFSTTAGSSRMRYNYPFKAGKKYRIKARFYYPDSSVVNNRLSVVGDGSESWGLLFNNTDAWNATPTGPTFTVSSDRSSIWFVEGTGTDALYHLTDMRIEEVFPSEQLVSASDANDQIDALGNAISEPRTNTQVLNLFGEGELVTTPAAASLDTIKTVSGWIWHDATARTVFDLGTPTVGTTTTALTSSGFTGVTYFVNGASGTTLSAGWNHCVVASTAALATDNIDILAKSGSQIDYDVTLTVAEALVNYDAQKSLYGL
jgi:hypothetical protein